MLRSAVREWQRDGASRLGAAIAYYAMISLSPLLLIAIAIGGAIFGETAARREILDQIGTLIGEESARGIETIIANSLEREERLRAGAIGIGVLVLGAAGVFVHLQEALNTIWGVQRRRGAFLQALLRKYFLSFGMVAGVGFLLLVSLVASAALAGLGAWLGRQASLSLAPLQILNTTLSFVLITLLFAMIFRFLPDVELEWRDVWIGAGVSSLLFAIGKWLIGVYLGQSSLSSAYGAAGSLVVILVWVYYSAQIMLFGVELTKCWKRSRRPEVVPEPHAESADENEPAPLLASALRD